MNHPNPVPQSSAKLYGVGLIVIGVIGGIIFAAIRPDTSLLSNLPAIITIGIGIRQITKAEAPRTRTAPQPHTTAHRFPPAHRLNQPRTDHIADVLTRAHTQHDPYSGQPWEVTSAAAINQHLQQCSTCSASFTRGRV